MTVAACCLSHSPLIGLTEPPADVRTAAVAALARAREWVAAYDPTLVVLFAPDHFNGFLYDVLPQFCVGTAAAAIGDYGTGSGALNVPAERARTCAEAVLAAGVDTAISARMKVDHAFAQPLEQLFGGIAARPVIPVFINAAAAPLAPIGRSRQLGAAVGAWAAGLDERVLVIGSGGLSHDPPTPSLDDATPETLDRLLNGISDEARAARQHAVVAVATEFAAGGGGLKPIAPTFDKQFMQLLARGAVAEVDSWDNDWLTESIGRAVHEIRTWIASFAALQAAVGDYTVAFEYYQPIPEWIAGYGIMTAAGAGA